MGDANIMIQYFFPIFQFRLTSAGLRKWQATLLNANQFEAAASPVFPLSFFQSWEWQPSHLIRKEIHAE